MRWTAQVVEFRIRVMRQKSYILSDIQALVKMHQLGKLGGEKMPEDARPKLPAGSRELVHYLTFPMALNYQRNSYKLWEAATKTFEDESTCWVFEPGECATRGLPAMRKALLKHKLALQPNKHPATWFALARAFTELCGGDVRNLLKEQGISAQKILEFVQVTHKKRFPYLSGEKIANYWLYVIHSYTSFRLVDPEALTVAPDTHVLQASVRLGVVEGVVAELKREVVAERWRETLKGSGLSPIEIHTPLWLWSRGGFAIILPALR